MGIMVHGDEDPSTPEAGMGRKISNEHKIQGGSLPEIHRAWKLATVKFDHEDEMRQAARGAVTSGNLLIAMVLYCLTRPEDELREMARWGLEALERMKESDNPVDLGRIPGKDFGALGDNPGRIHEGGKNGRRGGEPSAPKKRSKRTG